MNRTALKTLLKKMETLDGWEFIGNYWKFGEVVIQIKYSIKMHVDGTAIPLYPIARFLIWRKIKHMQNLMIINKIRGEK